MTLIVWIIVKIIDITVKSSNCKSFEYWKAKEDMEEYADWYEKQQEDCQANHKGSAGKMETDGGREMFARSIPLYGKPYV